MIRTRRLYTRHGLSAALYLLGFHVFAWEPGPRSSTVDLSSYRHVYYVSPDTRAAGNGQHEKPWTSLNQALERVQDCSAVARCAILVSAGKIAEGTIRMKPYIDLYGGFNAGNWKRDLPRHRTTLSGEKGGRVLIGATDSVLDGFTLTAGQVRGMGAGLLCDGTSPVIRNNVFLENQTLASENWSPKNRHEIAHDGGAIFVTNRGAPIIERNLFVGNRTESGRGAGIALHGHCSGRISSNVFLENISGTKDPNRSSDGAAVSVFDWSSPVIEKNLFFGNRALGGNDAGGLFIALWSSPKVSENTFAGNEATDDGGGLFFGGQEHRYDRPLDPLPDARSFFVVIDRNVFVGNTNSASNSGALRFTMEGRGRFSNNVVLENTGVYFQRSEVQIVHNTILDAFRIVETKEGLGPSRLANNILWAPLFIEAPVLLSHCNLLQPLDGPGNISRSPEFVKDDIRLPVQTVIYHRDLFVSSLIISKGFDAGKLLGRPLQSQGKWSVVGSVAGQTLTVWGDFSGSREVRFPSSGHLAPNSPGIDSGSREESVWHDMDGQKRPLGRAPDIGADEVPSAQGRKKP